MMKYSKMIISFLFPAAAMLVSGCREASTTIGGTVTGASARSKMVLVSNCIDAKSVGADGSFTFDGQAQAGTTYNVGVSTQPDDGNCTVANGTGTVGQYSQAVNNIWLMASRRHWRLGFLDSFLCGQRDFRVVCRVAVTGVNDVLFNEFHNFAASSSRRTVIPRFS